jgi:hypothetical protein
MITNNNPKTFGMFSSYGKQVSCTFQILAKKDKILEENKHRFFKFKLAKKDDKIFDLDSESEYNSNEDDIFSSNYVPLKTYDTKTTRLNKRFKINPAFANKKQIKNKENGPSCVKYNPKYDYIQRKNSISCSYDKSRISTPRRVLKEEVSPKFYLSHGDLKLKNGFKFSKSSKKLQIRTDNNFNEKINNSICSTTKSNMSKTGNLRCLQYTNESTDLSKTQYFTTMGKHKKTFSTTESLLNVQKNKQQKFMQTTKNSDIAQSFLKVMDFKKSISRDQAMKRYDDKRTYLPFSIPSFDAVLESIFNL